MPITRITPPAQREFERLPLVIQARVLAIFERLNEWPDVSGAKPLRGNLAGNFRMRTGSYRILFRINAQGDPLVWHIGNRKDVYEE
jgi:mRNA-degrading endonuclease RelE of RelBE toxin-antitoxin system